MSDATFLVACPQWVFTSFPVFRPARPAFHPVMTQALPAVLGGSPQTN